MDNENYIMKYVTVNNKVDNKNDEIDLKSCSAVLVRYGEIGIKGKNRYYFEGILVENIKSCLIDNKIAFTEIKKVRGRIIVISDDRCLCLKNVFGIVSISPAKVVKLDVEEIKKAGYSLLVKKKFETFRVDTHKLTSYDKPSMELNSEVGEYLLKEFSSRKINKKVKLKGADIELGIEIIGKEAYIFVDKIKGFGGLPVGCQGKVICLIEDKASILACWFVLKRGCQIIPIGYTEHDLTFLKFFSYGSKLEFVKIYCIDDAKMIAKKNKANAIVVNDKLDQIRVFDDFVVLRPLIVFTEQEIIEKIKGIENESFH